MNPIELQEGLLADKNLQSLFNTTPYALLIITDGVFVDSNAAALHIFKARNKSDIIGKPPSILSPPVQPDGIPSDKAAEKYLRIALAGEEVIFEWQHIRQDNPLFLAKVHLKTFMYNDKPSLLTAFEDINELRARELEISCARTTMQTMYDGTPCALLVLGDGIFLNANSTAATLFGAQSVDDIIGKSPLILSPPNQPDGTPSDTGAMKHIQKAISGSVESFDWVHQRLDGTQIDCHVIIKAFEYVGKPALMTVVMDNAEQKKKEREMHHLKERADWIIEKNPSLMFVFNRDLTISKTNQAWADVSGYTPKQLASMKLSDFNVVDRRGGTVKDVLATGTAASGDLTLIAPRGTLHLRYTYIPIPSESREIEEILGVYFDETDP